MGALPRSSRAGGAVHGQLQAQSEPTLLPRQERVALAALLCHPADWRSPEGLFFPL